MKYINHLIELRNRFLKILFFIFILFLILFYFSNDIYDLIISLKNSDLQLIKNENEITLSKLGSTIIATSITSTLITPLKLSFIISILLSMPYIIYHMWFFITPGLYTNEKKQIYPYIITSLILFYIGIFFSYYIICPFTIQFLKNCAPDSVIVMTDMNNILNFILNISFSCGILFQIPIIILSLLHFNVISINKLLYLRPYIIILSFIIGMLITPPDIISQIIVALPIWLLFELTLLLGKTKKFFSSKKNIKITNNYF